MVYVLWECPAYDSIRNTFIVKAVGGGGGFEEFSSTLNNFNKAGFILGCEL